MGLGGWVTLSRLTSGASVPRSWVALPSVGSTIPPSAGRAAIRGTYHPSIRVACPSVGLTIRGISLAHMQFHNIAVVEHVV